MQISKRKLVVMMTVENIQGREILSNLIALKFPVIAVIIEHKSKAKVLIEKVNTVYNLVMQVDEDKASYYKENYSAIPFVRSIKDQVNKKYWLSKKQMETLNKVYKKYLKRKEKLDGRKNNK